MRMQNCPVYEIIIPGMYQGKTLYMCNNYSRHSILSLLIVEDFLALSPAASHFNAATELSNIGTLIGKNSGM